MKVPSTSGGSAHHWSLACVLGLWLGWQVGPAASGHPAAAGEPRMGLGPREFLAGVLAKVPPYVRWPAAAFGAPDDPFVIGLLGEDPTEGLLAPLVQGARISGREVAVKVFPAADQVAQCQMLYVPSARAAEWEAASKKVGLPHLLAVGEDEAFGKSGGVLTVSLRDRKLHVFPANARKARLEVDARLLKIAQVHR